MNTGGHTTKSYNNVLNSTFTTPSACMSCVWCPHIHTHGHTHRYTHTRIHSTHLHTQHTQYTIHNKHAQNTIHIYIPTQYTIHTHIRSLHIQYTVYKCTYTIYNSNSHTQYTYSLQNTHAHIPTHTYRTHAHTQFTCMYIVRTHTPDDVTAVALTEVRSRCSTPRRARQPLC